jgi:hypothetical protein
VRYPVGIWTQNFTNSKKCWPRELGSDIWYSGNSCGLFKKKFTNLFGESGEEHKLSESYSRFFN